MLCPACGRDNRPGRKFCAACGAELELDCASCGAHNEPGERFCGECGQSLEDTVRTAHTPPTLAVPASFSSGRYEVKRFLGEGGKKRVYLAHDTLLDRDVAFALIKTEGLDETSRTRITREAQAMRRLGDHPHIVTVFDIGEEGGQPFIVSQFMSGGDVEGLIEKAEDRRLLLEEALRIATQVCLGLEHAHASSPTRWCSRRSMRN